MVCAVIRVAGTVLQAILLQRQHTASSTNTINSTASALPDQCTQQGQQQLLALPAANQQMPGNQPDPSKQQGQQCSAAPDWLDEGSNLIGLQAHASTAAVAPAQVAAATPCTALEAALSSGSDGRGTVVLGGVSAVGVLNATGAATAADLLAALTAHARGEASVSTSVSTSGTSSADSSAAAVGVRVSALLELQQLMLVLADAAATAQRSQKPPAPCTQQQGSNGSSDRTGSSSKGNTVNGTTCSTGISVVLGPYWLQSVLGAAMEALSHADPSLRRWVLLRLP